MAKVRKKSAQRDVTGFALGGGLLLFLAGAFLWTELHLALEYLVTVAAVIGVGLCFVRTPPQLNYGGMLLLASSGVYGGIWYGVQHPHPPEILPGLAVIAVGAVLNVVRQHGDAKAKGDTTRMNLIWSLMTLAALATSWVFYEHFLRQKYQGTDEGLWRRLVLTLSWLVAGISLVVAGRVRSESAVRYSGYVFVTLAFAKALAYDTVKLGGTLRIATLAVAGVVLMAGAMFLSRSAEAGEDEEEEEEEDDEDESADQKAGSPNPGAAKPGKAKGPNAAGTSE